MKYDIRFVVSVKSLGRMGIMSEHDCVYYIRYEDGKPVVYFGDLEGISKTEDYTQEDIDECFLQGHWIKLEG